jgi:hypothetical protein
VGTVRPLPIRETQPGGREFTEVVSETVAEAAGLTLGGAL